MQLSSFIVAYLCLSSYHFSLQHLILLICVWMFSYIAWKQLKIMLQFVTYSNSTLVRLREDTFLSDAYIKAYIDFRHMYKFLLRGVLF